ncbi:MAG TPA: EAL domain-containing protein [Myxococcales bacterium]|nr:EAL domain-containing protein [Myxococcales bacterium]
MHRRLQRQLAALPGGPGNVPAELRDFVEAVEGDYRKADEDRALLERSIHALTELLARGQQAQATAERRRHARAERSAKATRRIERAQGKSGLAQLELSADLVVRGANPAAARLCGTGLESMIGAGLFSLLQPPEAEAMSVQVRARLAGRESVAQTLSCTARDGRALICDFVCTPRLRRDGSLLGARAIVRDETARAQAQEATREREERAGLALGGAGEVLWDWNLKADRLFLSARFQELLGIQGPLSGKSADWFDRVHPDDLTPLRSALDAHVEGGGFLLENEHRVRHADGSFRWVSVRGTVLRDQAGTAVRALGLMRDVSRHRELVERMAHDARHDALTGLPNRTLFLDLLRHSFNRIRRHEDYRFALLFIDIDRFKLVNDALGHQMGDELLVQIARRLESCLREGDTLARHAGDEFTMWLDDVRGAPDALHVADRVHAAMREAFQLGGQNIQSSASIGVAIGSSRYTHAEEVLRDADAAMYRAKAQGKARTAVFEVEPGERPLASLTLETDLRRALLRDELRVYYMPIVAVATGRVEGFEALARWQHPRLGLVAPAQFLGLALETGLIVAIDQWVLQTASRQLNEWRRDVDEAATLSLSVNLSQNLLEQRDVGIQIDRFLRDAGLSPRDLNLDISESTLSGGSAQTAGLLADLRQRGHGLHIDEFGTGQAWLRHLHADELDSVKIDRSFVASLASSGGDRKVLRSIVSIARDLGKKVIAQGVETAEQLRYVREAGCDSAQGFFFSAPVDKVRARGLLRPSAAVVQLA